MLMYGPGPGQRSRQTRPEEMASYKKDAAKIIANRMQRPMKRCFEEILNFEKEEGESQSQRKPKQEAKKPESKFK